MEFRFVGPAIKGDRLYPALTSWLAEPRTQAWREFGQHWPRTIPCDLIEHCQDHGVAYHLTTDLDHGWYCVALQWFDFEIDYFALMPDQVRAALQGDLRVLFYYDEGDNPWRIRRRLDQLCQIHDLSPDCYRFVSANSQADSVPGFAYLCSDELLYWRRNRHCLALPWHSRPRDYKFTILNRTHKWWRATVMADLHTAGVLDHSLWSYNCDLALGDDPADNPIQVDTLGLTHDMTKFIQGGPYVCDTLTADQHNDHTSMVPQHHTDSYCNIVIETHFDCDQSGGCLITEKTFKPIKHAQPFVIVGAAGTLAVLRDLGYRTFDHVMDNSYDTISDNTQRWLAVRDLICQLNGQDLYQWFLACKDDVLHNQQLFLSRKQQRLNRLHDKLLHQLATS